MLKNKESTTGKTIQQVTNENNQLDKKVNEKEDEINQYFSSRANKVKKRLPKSDH